MCSQVALEERLIAIARGSAWFMPVLRAVRELGLASWCVGAGAVRNLVWDALDQRRTPSALADIDVAYFDACDLAPEREAELQQRLARMLADTPWEVTNQAGVHRWFEACFGESVRPLSSLEDAVASWPEYATCVGLALLPDDAIRVIAPYGLGDLFSQVVRRNPTRVSAATYRRRVEQKCYAERWPNVAIVRC